MSVTIGKFTVSDSDQLDGDGCNEVMLTNNSSSVDADVTTFRDSQAGIETANPASNGFGVLLHGRNINLTEDGGSATPADNGELLVPVQAVLQDGSSMLTGQIGNITAHSAAPSGNFSCVNDGGIAGT
jgi:hypothetical protein